jgi:mono/diheme cytochrome c family protein
MTVLKWLLIAVLCLVVCAVGATLVFFYGLNPKVKDASAQKAPTGAEAVARGKYLAENVAACMACHSESDADKPGDPIKPGMLGSGRDFGPLPDFPGRVRAGNLTPDPKHGLAGWSDGEIVRAVREGVDRKGRTLFPFMPYSTYRVTLSDDDAFAIVAYLRSLPPVDHDPGPMEVDFPVSMFVRAAPLPVDRSPPPAPAPSDVEARGAWLLLVASCGACHTPIDGGRPNLKMQYAGNDLPFTFGDLKVYAPNVTSDAATGLGAWSDADILKVLDEGVGKSGKPVYVMPWPSYRGMTDADKKAVVAALRKLPAIPHLVPASTKP